MTLNEDTECITHHYSCACIEEKRQDKYKLLLERLFLIEFELENIKKLVRDEIIHEQI